MVSFFIAALVGVGVGVLSGLLGIGGGTVMVPLFRLAFGMEPIAATATSLFTIVPTSISGMWKHAKNKTSLPRVGIVCGLTGACLSPVGVWAANVSPGWAIMGAAAVVVMCFLAFLYYELLILGVFTSLVHWFDAGDVYSYGRFVFFVFVPVK